MRNHTDITMILDRSGSMGSCRLAMEEALNAYVRDQKGLPDSCSFTLIKFDTDHEKAMDNLSIGEVGSICIEPRGGTALLDAVGRAIDEKGAELARMPESLRPNKVIFVIVTDGAENASRTYISQPEVYNQFTNRLPMNWPNKADRVMGMIKHQRDNYQWAFLFLGANQDAIAAATQMGIAPGNALNFDAENGGRNRRGSNYAAKAMSNVTRSLRRNEEKTDSSVLLCSANANPDDVDLEYIDGYKGKGELDTDKVKKATTESK